MNVAVAQKSIIRTSSNHYASRADDDAPAAAAAVRQRSCHTTQVPHSSAADEKATSTCPSSTSSSGASLPALATPRSGKLRHFPPSCCAPAAKNNLVMYPDGLNPPKMKRGSSRFVFNRALWRGGVGLFPPGVTVGADSLGVNLGHYCVHEVARKSCQSPCRKV